MFDEADEALPGEIGLLGARSHGTVRYENGEPKGFFGHLTLMSRSAATSALPNRTRPEPLLLACSDRRALEPALPDSHGRWMIQWKLIATGTAVESGRLLPAQPFKSSFIFSIETKQQAQRARGRLGVDLTPVAI